MARSVRPGDYALNLSILAAAGGLLVSAGFIYWACEYFVNGVEWVGRKTGVSQNAVGTVLAAFGTALPESVVTFVAVVFGHDAADKSIGVGAALGGPLVLATIAYPVVGIMLLLTWPNASRQPIELNASRLGRDQSWFLLIFLFKIALGFVAFTIKPWLGKRSRSLKTLAPILTSVAFLLIRTGRMTLFLSFFGPSRSPRPNGARTNSSPRLTPASNNFPEHRRN